LPSTLSLLVENSAELAVRNNCAPARRRRDDRPAAPCRSAVLSCIGRRFAPRGV